MNYPQLHCNVDNAVTAATKASPFGSDNIIAHIAREQLDPKEPAVAVLAEAHHVSTHPLKLQPVCTDTRRIICYLTVSDPEMAWLVRWWLRPE